MMEIAALIAFVAMIVVWAALPGGARATPTAVGTPEILEALPRIPAEV